MQHPNLANSNHPSHDSVLVAGHAAGDLADSERARAQALLDTCRPCADLHRDLIAIAAATRSLPNLAAAPRDFRLDAEQAARLRRGSWLRAALRPFASGRSATRPMAAAFTSLGIAGLFVVTILPGLLGATASVGAERDSTQAGGPASTSAAAPAPGGSAAALDAGASGAPMHGTSSARPEEVDPNHSQVDPLPTEGSGAVAVGGRESPDTDLQSNDEGVVVTTTSTPNPVLVGSLVLLAVGLLLFGLRFAARRIR